MAEHQFSNERWLPVVGFEGFYEVSDYGRVRSLDRVVPGGPVSDYFKPGRILKQRSDKDGYLLVTLSVDGIATTVKVHREVMRSFVGESSDRPEVNHVNAVRHDNKLDNLEWCTRLENLKDAMSRPVFHRVKHVVAECFSGGPSIWFPSTVAVAVAGFNRKAVSMCLSGKQKSHAGYKWRCA